MSHHLIDQLRMGPPTLDVGPAASALGFPRSTLYDAIKRGDAPVRVIRVGSRIKVLTESVIEALGGTADPVRSSETGPHLPSSEGMAVPLTTSGVK